MSKEQQDKLWNEISEESKKYIIDYKNKTIVNNQNSEWNKDYAKIVEGNLSAIFGTHNLNPKPQTPKTWEDVIDEHPEYEYDMITINNLVCIDFLVASKIVATYKIAKLIDLGYGGMVSEEEWKDISKDKFTIQPNPNSNGGISIVAKAGSYYDFISFHTKQQAEEFMSHESNRKLVEQYYLL